jgi:anaerobic ribonucleoside-triphosphate reductase activating protein
LLNIIQPFFATADGITISGGEPFEQFEELKALLAQLRSAFAGDILVYSGFERDSIEGSLSELNGLIDALITGPFKQEEPQTLPWRGSDNQVLHKLTELGEQRYENGDDPACANFKSLDIMFDDDSTIWMAGIPQRGDIKRLLVLLNQDGIRASSTEALGAPT